MAQHHILFVDLEVNQVVGFIEEWCNFPIIMISPDQIDRPALDAIPIHPGVIGVLTSRSEAEIAKNPEDIIFADHPIDIAKNSIVHAGNCFGTDFEILPLLQLITLAVRKIFQPLGVFENIPVTEVESEVGRKIHIFTSDRFSRLVKIFHAALFPFDCLMITETHA